jgi:hypothetical protein
MGMVALIAFTGMLAAIPSAPREKFPSRIRLRSPHDHAGTILRRHTGKQFQVPAGDQMATIETGDYIGGKVVVNEHWLSENTQLWEPA